MPRTVARMGWLASIFLLVAYNLSGLEDQLRAIAVSLWPFPRLPLGSAERVLADYLVGVLVVVNFACARFAEFSALDRHADRIRGLSFFTFPLYLAHALVLGIWRAFHPHTAGTVLDILGVTAIVFAFTWGLGRGAERLRIAALAWIATLPEHRMITLMRIKASRFISLIDQTDFSDPLAPPETDTLKRIPRKY